MPHFNAVYGKETVGDVFYLGKRLAFPANFKKILTIYEEITCFGITHIITLR